MLAYWRDLGSGGSDWFVTREQAGGGERRLVVILMMVLSAALLLVPYVQNLVIIVFLFAVFLVLSCELLSWLLVKGTLQPKTTGQEEATPASN